MLFDIIDIMMCYVDVICVNIIKIDIFSKLAMFISLYRIIFDDYTFLCHLTCLVNEEAEIDIVIAYSLY